MSDVKSSPAENEEEAILARIRDLRAEERRLGKVVKRLREHSRDLAVQQVETNTPNTHTVDLDSMEAPSLLASGAAHRFNNLLVGILGTASMLAVNTEEDGVVHQWLSEIELAALSGAALTSDLRDFAGQRTPKLSPLDLSGLVEALGPRLAGIVGSRITLQYDLSSDLPTVAGCADKIQKVILNLVENAVHAIGDGEGTITVLTRMEQAGRTDSEASPSQCSSVVVQDTGKGIPEAELDNIFIPFYGLDGRPGIGLSFGLGVMRTHSGTIRVRSKPGEGTSMSLLFPALHALDVDSRSDADQHRLQGTALLVDDEESVRTIGELMLKSAGFEVLAASNGRDALAMFAENRHKIRLVILDWGMPGMGGDMVLRELLGIDPAVKVLLSSGGPAPTVTEGEGRDIDFLPKPYRQYQLMSKIRSILNDTSLH